MAIKTVLFLSLLTAGLTSGFFYAYSYSVNKGLGRLGDEPYLRAMQSINRTVLNPAFFASFIGALVLLPVATWLEFRLVGSSDRLYALLAASLLYFLGVFLVTVRGNVPLNDALDKVDISELPADKLAQRRQAFELPWNRFHAIRTVAAILAFACVAWAAVGAGN